MRKLACSAAVAFTVALTGCAVAQPSPTVTVTREVQVQAPPVTITVEPPAPEQTEASAPLVSELTDGARATLKGTFGGEGSPVLDLYCPMDLNGRLQISESVGLQVNYEPEVVLAYLAEVCP
ncbi:hypothetical protein ACIGEP_15480 [Microbacterium sp. NPDC077663]|uniref:hypothetical protein n=1 Tax=Microbacterium sp. NPDC077663 TaxID=3364189 RepID=UPI0037C67BBA